jgi:predicted transcriptional regulator
MVTVGDIMTKNVITLSTEDLVSTAISKMSDHRVHHIPVLENGKYVGMIDYNLLFKRSSLSVTTKIRTIMEKTPSVSPGLDVSEAARIMIDTGQRALPVAERGKLKGIVTSTDIVHSVNSISQVAELTASDIMSGDPITVKEDDELDEAAKKMKDLDEITIPVTDKNGKVTGMININDISRLLLKEGGRMHQGQYYRNRSKPLVKDVMVPALTIMPDAKISSCMEGMIKSDARVCTVVDKNSIPQGIISHSDIMQEIVKGSSVESVLVNLSGVRFDDPEIYENIYSIIQKSVKTIARFRRMKPLLVNIHIEEYKQQGGEQKYSVRGKMITESKTLFTRAWDWNIFKAVKDLMTQFENMTEKTKIRR